MLNLLAQEFNPSKSDFEVVEEWRKQYGDVFTSWLAGKPVVGIADFDIAKDAFLTRGTDFAGRVPMSGIIS